MDELTVVLKQALPHIRWFAMGEAICLCKEIERVLQTEVPEEIVNISKQTISFLNKRSTKEAQQLYNQLTSKLDQLKLKEY